MAGSEERLLKEYFDGISRELEDIPQVKMNAAIRSGISGPARNRTSARKRFSVSVAVVLAAAALFAVPWIGKQPEPLEPQNLSAPSQMIEAFTPYFEKSINDTTVSTAIEAGLIERVSGVTAEQNGFVLKVDGIAADRKGIMILYSLQNNTGQKARVDNLQLEGRGYSPVNYPYGFSLNIRDVPTGTTYDYEILQWAGGLGSLPDQITLELVLGKSRTVTEVSGEKPLAALSVPITLDKGKIAKSGEVHTVNKTLTVDGQEIRINEVYTAATGIYLEPVYNEHNGKQIFSMINPRFLLGSSRIYSSMSPVRTVVVEGKEILIFGNDSRSSQPLQFQLDGILALDKDALKLVIDTEKQQIIKAPDNYLTMSLYSAERGTTMILNHNTAPGKKKYYNALILDSEFTDSKGQIHSSAELYDIPPYQASADQKSIPVLDYVGLGSNKYAQPLTFTITSYPAPINQKVSLEIRD
ncbi:hypothetical protein [Paenibacillus sp. DMB5]|uniref:hypothetical protein n=1 Tax=Paenibacillus sp. DMB5 TaxID=1780103 RepID=UPI00076D4629|nr:hypothetical protein [Paenibacillus sp. DMB5]KUP22341.1 hypothetical protein AWJ19_07695 [Paenibacillus sp. DMB5]